MPKNIAPREKPRQREDFGIKRSFEREKKKIQAYQIYSQKYFCKRLFCLSFPEDTT